MKTFYVSLTHDLIGYYLVFNAKSEELVRNYLRDTYFRNEEWKLPWCAVYDTLPEGNPKLITPQFPNLY